MGTLKKKQPPGCRKPVYYYREVYRDKVNPEDRGKGKGRGSGPSRVVTRDTYLGTADELLTAVKGKERPATARHRAFGLVCAALRMCEELGIADAVDDEVVKRRQGHGVGTYIVVGILNKLTEPCSRRGMASWLGKTVLPERMGLATDLFSSANFWDQWEKICPEKPLRNRQEKVERGELGEEALFSDDAVFRIEERIWNRLVDRYDVPLDTILYDTTNFYTYLEPTTPSWLCRHGHNKASRHHLRQVGLSLAATDDGGLPILHALVRGNRHDAKLFPESVTTLAERLVKLGRGTRGVTVVFDKGNNSEDNVHKVRGAGFHLVGSLVPSHRRDLLGRALRRYETRLPDGRLAHGEEQQVYGLPCRVVVVYNPKSARKQERTFRRKLQRLREEVREVFHTKVAQGASKAEIAGAIGQRLRASEVRGCLKVEVGGRRYKTLSARLDRTAVARRLRRCGKQIIFTDRTELSTEEVIALYERRPTVEHAFRQIKDPHTISWQPAHCWTDSKLRVYALICVLALLVLKLMLWRVRQAGLEMSWKVLATELADLQELILVYPDLRVAKMISERSSVQEKLYELFDLARYAPP